MKRINLVTVFLAGIIGLSGVTHAASVSDSFNRDVPVQTSASSPNLIGTNYTIVSGSWSCSNTPPGYLYSDGSSQGVMVDTSLQTINTGGTNFVLSANISVDSPSSPSSVNFGGLIFNYQDSDNYYVFSYYLLQSGSYIQISKIENGNHLSPSVLGFVSTALTSQTYYTLSVSSSGNTYDFSLSDTNGTVLYSDSVIDATFSNGYAGFSQGLYSYSNKAWFDDYSLKVRQDPKVNLIMYSSP